MTSNALKAAFSEISHIAQVNENNGRVRSGRAPLPYSGTPADRDVWIVTDEGLRFGRWNGEPTLGWADDYEAVRAFEKDVSRPRKVA